MSTVAGMRLRSTLLCPLGLVLVLGGCSAGWAGAPEAVQVASVVDGDTIVVRTATGATRTVRILGVDTPETKKPGVPIQCFGSEASAFTHRRLEGRRVRLGYDVERHDKYGRTLAAVIVDGRDYARTLLAEGYARLLVIAPNGRHSREYLALELDARLHRRGLWGACGS
jgi:micrococcal nuclease